MTLSNHAPVVSFCLILLCLALRTHTPPFVFLCVHLPVPNCLFVTVHLTHPIHKTQTQPQRFAGIRALQDDNLQKLKMKQIDHASYEERIQQVNLFFDFDFFLQVNEDGRVFMFVCVCVCKMMQGCLQGFGCVAPLFAWHALAFHMTM